MAVAEHPEIEQRVAGPRLDEEHDDDRGEAEPQAEQGRRCCPPGFGGQRQACDEEDRRGGREYRPGGVESAQSGVTVVGGDGDGRECGDECDERDVDGEDRPPSPGVGEHSAEDRAEHHARRTGRTPDAERPVPFGALAEADAEQRERRRRQRCSAEPLDAATGDEHPFAHGDRAECGSESEEAEADGEHASAPKGVREPAEEEEEAAEGDRVGADDPLQSLRGEPQAGDVGQGHEHDVVIEADEQLGKPEGRQQSELRAGGSCRHRDPPYSPSSDDTKSKHIIRTVTI